MNNYVRSGILAAALATLPGLAPAEDLNWASGWPAGGFIPNAVDKAAAKISEETSFKVKHFPLSLLSFNETMAGVRDGVADIGYVLMPYFPAEFAETNLASDLTMLATSGTKIKTPGLAMVGAMVEYVMLDCPDCQKEFAAQDQVFLAGGATTEYRTQCDRPVKTKEDMSGLKIRNGAANFGRFVEQLGAIKVAISGGEIYEAISSNAIDCAMVAIPELTSLQLIEVVKYVTMGAPGGIFAGTASANINRGIWEEMSPEDRTVFLKAGAQLTADISVGYISSEIDAIEKAKAKGIEFIDASPELIEFTNDFVKQDTATIADQYKSKYNLAEVDAKIAKITALIDKWKGLTDPYETNADGFAELLWSEVYSKLDVATYGLQ